MSDGRGGIRQSAGCATVVTQDFQCFMRARVWLDASANRAVGGVAVFLPVGQRLPIGAFAVGHDHLRVALIAAFSYHRAVGQLSFSRCFSRWPSLQVTFTDVRRGHQNRHCQMPRSCFVRLQDDNRSRGAMARANDAFIKRQRVEKSASFGGNVQMQWR